MGDVVPATPAEFWQLVREGGFRKPTSGICPGYDQANLVVLPKELAFDFLLFCQLNPQPRPCIDVSEAGSPHPTLAVPAADPRPDTTRPRLTRTGLPGTPIRSDGDVSSSQVVSGLSRANTSSLAAISASRARAACW